MASPYRIERTETVDAPVDLVYATVADVESYPKFLEEFESVHKRGDLVEMAVRAGPITLHWTQKVTFDPGKSIDFELVSGPFRSFRGGWRFAATGEQTRVRYWTEFELALRMPGISGIVERQVERNADRTLAAFQRRVGSIIRHRAEPAPESAPANAPVAPEE